MSEPLSHEVWSDFDGTGVHLVPKYDPRNWSKYPLRQIEGYGEFLEGITSQDVAIAGIVSRRPAMRRFVTMRSIAKHGWIDHFPDPETVILAGSESAKALHVVKRAEVANVGLIEDKPHKIMPHILGHMTQSGDTERITLGVVHSARQLEYEEIMLDFARANYGAELRTYGDMRFDMEIEEGIIAVVALMPYSEEEGDRFAAELLNGARNED